MSATRVVLCYTQGEDFGRRSEVGQVASLAFDGASQLQVRLEGNTVWLTQKLIAELYGVSVKTVNEHLVNIYSDAELPPEATIRSFRIVQREGSRDVSRNVEHYSLDAILAVGYRVWTNERGIVEITKDDLVRWSAFSTTV